MKNSLFFCGNTHRISKLVHVKHVLKVDLGATWATQRTVTKEISSGWTSCQITLVEFYEFSSWLFSCSFWRSHCEFAPWGKPNWNEIPCWEKNPSVGLFPSFQIGTTILQPLVSEKKEKSTSGSQNETDEHIQVFVLMPHNETILRFRNDNGRPCPD